MAWLCVDIEDEEWIYNYEPHRHKEFKYWEGDYDCPDCVNIDKGTIEKLIGRKLTWEDDCVELEENLIESKVGEQGVSSHVGGRRPGMRTIENAANAYVGHPQEIDEDASVTQVRNAFMDGAACGIRKFKTSLWHDASEEPIPHGDEVVKVYPHVECIIDINGKFCIRPWNTVDKCWDDEGTDDFFCEMSEIKRWAYLSDILSEEGNGV